MNHKITISLLVIFLLYLASYANPVYSNIDISAQARLEQELTTTTTNQKPQQDSQDFTQTTSTVKLPLFFLDLGYKLEKNVYAGFSILNKIQPTKNVKFHNLDSFEFYELYYRQGLFTDSLASAKLSVTFGKVEPQMGGFYYYLDHKDRHNPQNFLFNIQKPVIGGYLNLRYNHGSFFVSITEGQNFDYKASVDDKKIISHPLIGAKYVHNFHRLSLLTSLHYKKVDNDKKDYNFSQTILKNQSQRQYHNYTNYYLTLATRYKFSKFEILLDFNKYSFNSNLVRSKIFTELDKDNSNLIFSKANLENHDNGDDNSKQDNPTSEFVDQKLKYTEKSLYFKLSYNHNKIIPYIDYFYSNLKEHSDLSSNYYHRHHYSFGLDYKITKNLSCFANIKTYYLHYGLSIPSIDKKSIYHPSNAKSASIIIGIKSMIDNLNDY